MKKLIESVNEDWKKNLATGLTTAALLTGGPHATQAHADSGHHRKHHHGLSSHSYSEQDIVKTLIGEASNQGFDGMYAIACAIHNRLRDPYYKNNILHGVYGKNASHIAGDMRDEEIVTDAQTAYATAFKNGGDDPTRGATLWGNDSDLVKFRTQPWFKNVVPTVKIGAHTFFRTK